VRVRHTSRNRLKDMPQRLPRLLPCTSCKEVNPSKWLRLSRGRVSRLRAGPSSWPARQCKHSLVPGTLRIWNQHTRRPAPVRNTGLIVRYRYILSDVGTSRERRRRALVTGSGRPNLPPRFSAMRKAWNGPEALPNTTPRLRRPVRSPSGGPGVAGVHLARLLPCILVPTCNLGPLTSRQICLSLSPAPPPPIKRPLTPWLPR